MNQVTLPEERDLTGAMMEYRQRSGPGNTMILQYMLDWFRQPKDTPATFWVSQILQGICIKYGVEHWRRSIPHCMGTLYWQLNDVWAAPTWASLDTRGRWKALHYMARNFFAPVLVSIVENPEALTYEIWVTSDRQKEGSGDLEITLMTADGEQVQASSQRISIPLAESRIVMMGSAEEFINKQGARNTLLFVKLSENQTILSENFSSFVKPKHLELCRPELDVTIKMTDDTTAELTVTAKHPALWSWIECLDEELEIRFSDNFFHVVPRTPRCLTLELSRPMTADELSGKLLVQTLYNTYNPNEVGTAPASIHAEQQANM